MSVAIPFATGLLLLIQVAAPSVLDRVKALNDTSAARLVAAEQGATRLALDEILARVDASVHSDRQRPEQRRVQYDEPALTLGVRVGSLYARATGDRSYERRFKARRQRLAGTKLLNDRRYRPALVALRAALREAEALDDRWLETITRVNLAYGHLELGQGAQALAECERAFALSRTLDDKARGLTLFNLASVHLHLGNFERSIDYSQQAAAASQKAGIRLWEGNSLLNIGAAHQQLGDLDASRAALEKALAVLEKTSDRLGVGRALYNLGLVAARQQRNGDAAAYMERALPIIRSVDIRHSHAIELDAKAYQNPLELAALQVLVSAYGITGDAQKGAVHAAALRKLKERQPAAAKHTHGPPK